MTAAAENGADLGNVDLARGTCGDLIRAVFLFAYEDGDLDTVYAANDIDDVIGILVFKAAETFVFFCDLDVRDLTFAEIGNVCHGECFCREGGLGLTFKEVAADLCMVGTALDELCGDLMRDGGGIGIAEAARVCRECRIEQRSGLFGDLANQKTVDDVIYDLGTGSGTGIDQIMCRKFFVGGMVV